MWYECNIAMVFVFFQHNEGTFSCVYDEVSSNKRSASGTLYWPKKIISGVTYIHVTL